MTITSAVAEGNYHDRSYQNFIERFQHHFYEKLKEGKEPLFTTDVEGLWKTYLDSFSDPLERQHHNCNACRHFIERFGGLAMIDEQGLIKPAVMDAWFTFGNYASAVEAMGKLVRRAKITGVFLSSQLILGQPVTGVWRHMSVQLPTSMQYFNLAITAEQRMAEKKEDFKNISRALSDFTLPLLEQALTLLNSEVLYRSEKVLGPVKWLHDLMLSRNKAKNKQNVVWRAIATAPPGFCHPRSSMAGTLLEDLLCGMSFEMVSRRFKEKMHPLQYQRPQAAPNVGTIRQAEKLVEQLGAAGSLARRFARVEEIEAIWRPSLRGQGVFDHLYKQEVSPSFLNTPSQIMTWEKFLRTVLPLAEKIEFHASARKDSYVTLVTAVDPDAPPILQWDTLEHRNPFSWYLWNLGSTPSHYGLRQGSWCEVSAVTYKPSMWGERELSHQGKGVIFILKDARESCQAGAGLFPEILKPEFHSIRSVVEAYSQRAKIEGMENSTACGIALFQSSTPWNHTFRVTAKSQKFMYKLDRWD